ncbi:TPA: hypothetical protein DCL30_01700 [Candidatus Peribacteria bacterium]|nr:hypothetical protein [Candidatus Peribacteria bacterium]
MGNLTIVRLAPPRSVAFQFFRAVAVLFAGTRSGVFDILPSVPTIWLAVPRETCLIENADISEILSSFIAHMIPVAVVLPAAAVAVRSAAELAVAALAPLARGAIIISLAAAEELKAIGVADPALTIRRIDAGSVSRLRDSRMLMHDGCNTFLFVIKRINLTAITKTLGMFSAEPPV